MERGESDEIDGIQAIRQLLFLSLMILIEGHPVPEIAARASVALCRVGRSYDNLNITGDITAPTVLHARTLPHFKGHVKRLSDGEGDVLCLNGEVD